MYTVLGYNDMSSRILPFSFKTVEVVWRERNFWRWDCITLHLVKRKVSQAQECSLVGQEAINVLQSSRMLSFLGFSWWCFSKLGLASAGRLSLQCGSPKAWLPADVRQVENLFDVQRSLVSQCSSLATTRRIELIYDGTRVTPKSLESRH